MINWRKPAIYSLLYLTGSQVPENFRYMKKIEHLPRKEIEDIQKEKLTKLLKHAHQNCPYYTKVLSEAGVIKNDSVILDNFEKIPFLTKKELREHFNDIKSRKKVSKKSWVDTSGGSTGVPVKFIKDNKSWDFGIASQIFFTHLVGKEIGEKEIKLWGSERDTLKGSETVPFRLKNFLYNRKLQNSFLVTDYDLKRFVEEFNSFKPKSVWCYTESIYELARFIQKHSLTVYSPPAIICTAGTLTDYIKNTVEETFKTKVYNQYGSREVGCVAAECKKQEGMHIFEFSQLLEVVDDFGQEVLTGQVGENVITNLTNFTFPLIRFQIGDTSVKKDGWCSCGRNLKLLKTVTGRTSDHFKSKSGAIVHGEYFTHLFYHRPWVKKFQVVQKAIDRVEVYVVLESKQDSADISDITQKIKHVLGEQCQVKFNFVPQIKPLSSGKYRYTISQLD